MDICFYEAFEEEQDSLKSLLPGNLSCEFTSKTIQEAGHKSPPSRLISIRTQSQIPLSWAGELDGILSRSTGYDHLIQYRKEIREPLPLGYLEEYASRAVAEHAVLLAAALLKKLPKQVRQMKTFDRDGLTGVECQGKKFLVVGVGRIGSEIVEIAQGFGFVVKGVDIVPDKPGVDYVSKKEGIAWADVIACAMNLTPENTGYFSCDLLKSAKSGCVFVNIARGEHAPLADLDRLMSEGHLGGLGLDVFEDEKAVGVNLRSGAKDSKEAGLINRLLSHPNVLLTPHNAFNTRESLRRKSEMTVLQIKNFLKHRDFLWKV